MTTTNSEISWFTPQHVTYIGKNTPEVCFGQTGTLHKTNPRKHKPQLFFVPDGEKDAIEVAESEIWTSSSPLPDIIPTKSRCLSYEYEYWPFK